jgi:hypothetical protein
MTTERSYKVRIGRVVLHGAALTEAEAEGLRVTLEAELGSALADDSPAAITPGTRPRVVAPPLRAADGPTGLAGALARSLGRAISGGGE